MGNEWAPVVTTFFGRRGSAAWKESVSKTLTVSTFLTLSSGRCHRRPNRPRNPCIS